MRQKLLLSGKMSCVLVIRSGCHTWLTSSDRAVTCHSGLSYDSVVTQFTYSLTLVSYYGLVTLILDCEMSTNPRPENTSFRFFSDYMFVIYKYLLCELLFFELSCQNSGFQSAKQLLYLIYLNKSNFFIKLGKMQQDTNFDPTHNS